MFATSTRFRFCAAVLLLAAGSGVQASYYEGYEAYSRGDFETALREWREVASAGFSLFGSGIPEDKEKRAEMADARYAIGLLYWNGKGVERNFRESAKWLHDAAEIGHADAQLKLGYMYINGKGIPQDYGKARKWLSQSAEQGNMDAQYNLAVLYYKGLGTPQDMEKARYWFDKAAAQGDKVSKRVLADLATGLDMQQPPSAVAAASLATPMSTPAAERKSPAVPGTPKPESVMAQSDNTRDGRLRDPAWLASQPDGHFTVQLIALSGKEGLEKLAKRHAGQGPFGYYTKHKGDATLYVLVQGVYPSADQARAALAAYPAELRRNNPFVKKIADIREYLD